MAGHTSEKRWRSNQTNDSGTGVSVLASSTAGSLIDQLTQAEALYQELLEVYTYVGSTAQLLADQLFFEDWVTRESDPIGNPGVLDTQANSDELAKATDLINSMTSAHELYQCANNIVVAQEDRFAQLRRMS